MLLAMRKMTIRHHRCVREKLGASHAVARLDTNAQNQDNGSSANLRRHARLYLSFALSLPGADYPAAITTGDMQSLAIRRTVRIRKHHLG